MSQITFADGTKASVNTNTAFVTLIDAPNRVPMTCTSILSEARTSGSRANFLKKYMLQGTQNTNLKVNLELLKIPMEALDSDQNVANTPGYDDIDKYLNTVQYTQLPVLQLVSSCLSEANTPDMRELKEKELEYENAKERYESITNGVERVSYYEGWFPIFRPMKESSLFILFGISIVIITVSILFFLKLVGFSIEISLPVQFYVSMYSYLGHTLQYYSGYLIGGSVVGIICVLVAFDRGWI